MATVLLTSVMTELGDAPMPPTQLNNMALMYDRVHLKKKQKKNLPAGAFWCFCQSRPTDLHDSC